MNEKSNKHRLEAKKEKMLEIASLPLQFYKVISKGEDKFLSYYSDLIQSRAIEWVDNFTIPESRLDDESYEDYLIRSANNLSSRPSPYLFGDSDTGKTILASWLIYALIKRGVFRSRGPVFLAVPYWLDMMRPGKGHLEGEDWMYKAQNAPLIVLDDLGAEVSTPWAFERVYALLNHRRDQILPTIITSNLSLIDLQDKLSSKNEIGANRLSTRISTSCIPWKVKLK